MDIEAFIRTGLLRIKPVHRLIGFLLFLSLWDAGKPLLGQSGYEIRFRIRELKDTTCYIGNYYGKGTYIKDTLQIDGRGTAILRTGQDWPRGMYLFIISEKSYFDFIIDNDRRFSMETSLPDLVGRMTISGSPENKLFYDYLLNSRKLTESIAAVRRKTDGSAANRDSADLLRKELGALERQLVDYRLSIPQKYPGTFLTFLINLMKEPDMRDRNFGYRDRQDSAEAYRYFRQHFWDDVDFTDQRILYTPVFHKKLKKYFDYVLVQDPDTIIAAGDSLIFASERESEVFRYLVWFMTYQYENSELMGFDKVFVHLADTYYRSGRAFWISKTMNDNIVGKADRIRPLLLGKTAPEMVMADTSGNFVSMHGVRARFLLLLFWDPSCSHCVKEIPLIRSFYDRVKSAYGLEIFAVCTDTSLVSWKTAIGQNQMTWINVNGPRTLTGDYYKQYDIISTPLIYILDDRKVIIAKKLAANKLDYFMENWLRQSGGE